MTHLAQCAVVQILEPSQLCRRVVCQVLPETLLRQLLYIGCLPRNLLLLTINHHQVVKYHQPAGRDCAEATEQLAEHCFWLPFQVELFEDKVQSAAQTCASLENVI